MLIASRSNTDSGFAVASSTALIYDWVLTFGEEVELIWRQRWSLMTLLYLIIRYVGIPYYIINSMMGSSVTDAGSRKMLIFLTIIFLVVNITCGVIAAMVLRHMSGEELILSGTHACAYIYTADDLLLISVTWLLAAIWEVLALCLSVWVAVKHFRELRRLGPSTGSIIRDCFRVLLESHLVYFASFTVVCCSAFGTQLSPKVSDLDSAGVQISNAVFEIFSYIQMFVLGPRLILSVRMYHADLVANSDAAASITSIAFQDTIHVPTFSSV
ncbi:uncharacterized protein HD556DRAFT_1494875 [Suillus plorans]|uniref:DUF6533 domain-containing protein n=1 Tax=Suillus plorans TaxID=116603 RepID=A0A9P7AGZ3_9AGAM|nr:uncharacterized protein HD556DRAFT_1494875 [Suillus plorans]KAG1789269.1 hypothetical protein HD556DRAFT_1494875 [Suillus plorans]